MGMFSWITGGARSAEKVLDGITKGVDALILTDEERIKYNIKGSENYLEHMKIIAQESTPQSVSRRIIAWGVLGLVISLVVVCVALVLLGQTEKIPSVVAVADTFKIGWSFVSVIVFYFGTHVLAKMGSK